MSGYSQYPKLKGSERNLGATFDAARPVIEAWL
jgi:hypothetical protein